MNGLMSNLAQSFVGTSAGGGQLLPAETVMVGEHALTVRDVNSADLPAVLALHALVFGSQVDCSWFVWKYGQDDGDGKGQAVGAWCGEQLIAFCGGVPRVLNMHGRVCQGLQLADVMVHPMWRGILTRKGPFYYASSRFYGSRLGAVGERPFQLAFGFGSQIHVRLAVKVGLGLDSGQVHLLRWRAQEHAHYGPGWAWRWEALDRGDQRLAAYVERSWSLMETQARALTIGRRDAKYVQWRYVDRPADTKGGSEACYCFFVLRRPWSHQATGVAIMDLRPGVAQWLDWIGPLECLPTVVGAVRRTAAEAGAAEVTAWATPAVEAYLESTEIEGRDVCAWLGIPKSSCIAPEDVDSLNWWLMGGDTDYL